MLSACAVTQAVKTINPFEGEQKGCGNLIVYKLTEDKAQFISIALNGKESDLRLKRQCWINKSDILEVRWKVYDADVSSLLCNDVLRESPNELKNREATSGIVKILILEEELEKAKSNNPYNVTLELRKVVFEGLTLDYLQIENVTVGWLLG